MIVPAVPGWRCVILDENESAVTMNVAAWTTNPDERYFFPVILDPDGSPTVSPASLERVVGYLQPGDEMDGGWLDAASDLAKALREADDREYESRAAAS